MMTALTNARTDAEIRSIVRRMSEQFSRDGDWAQPLIERRWVKPASRNHFALVRTAAEVDPIVLKVLLTRGHAPRVVTPIRCPTDPKTATRSQEIFPH